MTRINLIKPSLLCDQHLLAEHRELTRIPNNLISGKYTLDANTKAKISPEYILGTGHVIFFLDKIDYLFERYIELHKECLERNFAVTWKFPSLLKVSKIFQQIETYVPTKSELSLNKARLIERCPIEPRYYGYKISQIQYIQMIMNSKPLNVIDLNCKF